MRYFLKNINTPEYLYVETSSHTEVNKYQDTVATADPEGPEDLDSDSIFLTWVFEFHEVLGAGFIDELNTQKTSDYDMTIDLYVANIDENESKKWRIIYKVVDER